MTTTIELDRLELGLVSDVLQSHTLKMKPRRGETLRDFQFRHGAYSTLIRKFEEAYERMRPDA